MFNRKYIDNYHIQLEQLKMTTLNRLQYLLTHLLVTIVDGTQYDDVADVMEEIENIALNDSYATNLKSYYENIWQEAYSCKGDMYEVKPIILEMLHAVDDLLADGIV